MTDPTFTIQWQRRDVEGADGEPVECTALTPRDALARLISAIRTSGPVTVLSVKSVPAALRSALDAPALPDGLTAEALREVGMAVQFGSSDWAGDRLAGKVLRWAAALDASPGDTPTGKGWMRLEFHDDGTCTGDTEGPVWVSRPNCATCWDDGVSCVDGGPCPEGCPVPVGEPADDPEGRCEGKLGQRPWWMSPGQYDPCPCDLKVGHPADLTDEPGGHWCEHIGVPCPDGWRFDRAAAAALREENRDAR